MLQSPKAPHKQSASYEQNQSKRDLAYGQSGANALSSRASRPCATALFERFIEIGLGGLKGRRGSEDDSGENGDGKRKFEHGGVYAYSFHVMDAARKF